MKNQKVGWHLEEIADLLELQGANPHKARAFRRAARKLASLPQPLEQVDLKSIPGIGEKIAEEVLIFLKKGSTPLLEELQKKTPEAVLELREFPGVDLKTAIRIFRFGGIKSRGQLKDAIKKKELRNIPGIGAKAEKDIKDYLQKNREGGPFLLSLAEAEAKSFQNRIETMPSVERVEITGDLRRGESLVDKIDVLLGTLEPDRVKEEIGLLPRIKSFSSSGKESFELTLPGGITAKVCLVSPENFVPALVKSTGPSQHWNFLRDIAVKKGLVLKEEGLFSEKEKIPIFEEKELYSLLELEYPRPEIRHRIPGKGEKISLPGRIVEPGDIKGDLHLHTRWSDGGSTIEEMVEKGRSLGYEYLAITDHSVGLEFAGGMSLAAMQEQMEYIDRLNEQIGEKYILKGIEADIEMDGSLDVPERFLDRMDWVVASLHRGFKLPEKEMTRRLIRAISHPAVRVLGHPTCRLFPSRRGISINTRELFRWAAEYQTAMEINGAPDRRDLGEDLIQVALEYDLEFCLGSDAHNDLNMEYMTYAVVEAQRAGLSPEKIINTRAIEDLPGVKTSPLGGEN